MDTRPPTPPFDRDDSIGEEPFRSHQPPAQDVTAGTPHAALAASSAASAAPITKHTPTVTTARNTSRC